MGCYDTLHRRCPKCGCDNEFQTKVHKCSLEDYELNDAPAVVLGRAAEEDDGVWECRGCGRRWKLHLTVHASIIPAKPKAVEED